MSIAVLTQVYDEVRRLAIAGSNLAPDDFRLRKLIPALKKSGEKAPVFAKVAELAETLLDGTAKQSAEALLSLTTLVNSVLYTQGETGAKGTLKKLETVDLGPPVTGTSARVLKPLIEALTTTGSGRLEIIRDAAERGAFRDIRLVNPTLKAIDDTYSEIAELVADKVLPAYGRTIYPELRETFDIKGRGGHVRRLQLMHRLDPKATRDLVEEVLEDGSKELKVAALACLGDSKDDIPRLLEQAEARAKNVREAALRGLSKFKTGDAVDALIKSLSGKDADIAIRPASRNGSPKVLAYLLTECQATLGLAVETKAKAKRATAFNRLGVLLRGLAERTDKKSISFLRSIFDRRDELLTLKGSATSADGASIVSQATNILVSTRSKPELRMLGESHGELPSEILACCFVGAALTMPPKKVFDEYSGYLMRDADKGTGKAKQDERERHYTITGILADIAHFGRTDQLLWFHDVGYEDPDLGRYAAEAKLDPRWLHAAIDTDERDLAIALRRPGDKKLLQYLTHCFNKVVAKSGGAWQATPVLDAMIDIGHPETTTSFVAYLKKTLKKGSQYHNAYWVSQLVPKLPEEAIAPLEELIPTLPDRAIDELAPQLADLKSAHAKA